MGGVHTLNRRCRRPRSRSISKLWQTNKLRQNQVTCRGGDDGCADGSASSKIFLASRPRTCGMDKTKSWTPKKTWPQHCPTTPRSCYLQRRRRRRRRWERVEQNLSGESSSDMRNGQNQELDAEEDLASALSKNGALMYCLTIMKNDIKWCAHAQSSMSAASFKKYLKALADKQAAAKSGYLQRRRRWMRRWERVEQNLSGESSSDMRNGQNQELDAEEDLASALSKTS